MAGSLSHITADDGTFRANLIENGRDAREALEECHQIIAYWLSMQRNPEATLWQACDELGFPRPKAPPVIQPTLHGAGSVYRPAPDTPT